MVLPVLETHVSFQAHNGAICQDLKAQPLHSLTLGIRIPRLSAAPQLSVQLWESGNTGWAVASTTQGAWVQQCSHLITRTDEACNTAI